jgi:Na+/proline symporter
VLSVVSLFSAIVIHMGVALYTAAWVLRGILGLAPGATILGLDALMLFIVVLGVLTGLYTMVGGLLAVVWTESAQTILLLAGAVVITVVGYVKVGGWTELANTLASNPHPLASVPDSKVTWGTGNFACGSFHRRPLGHGLCLSFLVTRCLASDAGAATRQ